MVSSPTGRGVVVFGETDEGMNIVMELTGDSMKCLKWTILDKSLKYPCQLNAIPLTRNAFVNLMQRIQKKTRKRKIEADDINSIKLFNSLKKNNEGRT